MTNDVVWAIVAYMIEHRDDPMHLVVDNLEVYGYSKQDIKAGFVKWVDMEIQNAANDEKDSD